MKKIKQYAMALMGSTVILSGCGDFLEPKSSSEFVPKDVTSLNELLLGEAYPRNDISGFNYFLTLMDDDVTATMYQDPETGFDENVFLASYTWQPDMFSMMKEAGVISYDMYYTYYRKIKGANAIIDYIGTVTGSENDINNVMAQAYALRGFYYLNLVNIFGQPYNEDPDGLGVPLKLTSGVEKEPLARNTVRQVYDQIVKDLLEAERLYNLLPAANQWKQNYRTSLPMVETILSRTYLYMENWEEAAKYAKKVMDDTRFKLLDLNTIPTTETESGQTKRVYTNYHSYSQSTEVIFPYGNVADWAGWVEDYVTESSSTGEPRVPYFRASDDLLSIFTDDDLRKERYIVRKDFNGEQMPLAIGKLNVNSSYRPTGGTGIFGRSVRLAEAYLNYMEAEAMIAKETGDANARQEAIQALNTLRSKRFAENYAPNPEDIDNADKLVEFIHKERRRELCFESHRWYDLRRWGMPEIKHVWYSTKDTKTVYTLQAKDPQYTVPIPETAIENNINLKQNPLASKRIGETTDNNTDTGNDAGNDND
ncbi:MAG TPA: RagB/SusD family nutrient uptake outer membrane protein [Prevotella sp.]|nr:RagB/SusD family nutrient uptake outer membrane protein [Prevotella sp.]